MKSSRFSRHSIALCLLSCCAAPSAMALRSSASAGQQQQHYQSGLFKRDPNCQNIQDLTQCAGFPTGFCCPSGNTCVGFGSKSLVCCPQGSGNCNQIGPTPCDVQFYNATASPQNPMHLSDLGVSLSKCGTGCCAPGYTCAGNTMCVISSQSSSASTSVIGSSSSSSSSSAGAAASTQAATLTTAPSVPTVTSAPSRSGAGVEGEANCPTFPTTAILTGFFSGFLGGSLLTLLAALCIARRRRNRNNATEDDSHRRNSSALGSIAAKVSDPIYNGTGATRTDFLRHASKSRKSPSTLRGGFGVGSPYSANGSSGSNNSRSGSPRMAKVRSLFSRTPTLTSRRGGDASFEKDVLGTGGGGVDDRHGFKTPPGQLKREPSMESIIIASPPDHRAPMAATTAVGRGVGRGGGEGGGGGAAEDRQTTFGDFLDTSAAATKRNQTPANRPPIPRIPDLFSTSPGDLDPRGLGVDGGRRK